MYTSPTISLVVTKNPMKAQELGLNAAKEGDRGELANHEEKEGQQ